MTPSFLFFHCMAGIGFALIGIAALGFLHLHQGALHERRWLLWMLVFSVLGPEIANQLAGLPPRWAGSHGLSMA